MLFPTPFLNRKTTVHCFLLYFCQNWVGGRGGRPQVPTALNSIDCLWLQLQKIWKIWCLLQSEMIAKAVQCAEKTFNSIKRSWEVKYKGHSILHIRDIKDVSSIQCRPPCDLITFITFIWYDGLQYRISFLFSIKLSNIRTKL